MSRPPRSLLGAAGGAHDGGTDSEGGARPLK
jgi:hypothetical protein